MLTTSLLRDQASVLTPMESRMILAMALTRFVNGLLDPAQQAAYAISMSALAKTIGLAESFVEIRHSATHDSLPALPVLRTALMQALDWLWHNYWEVAPRQSHIQTKLIEDESALRGQIFSLLKSWRKVRKAEPARPLKTGDPETITKVSFSILKDLVSIKDSLQNTQILAESLLFPKNLLSSNPKSVEIWTPLLETACKSFPELTNRLVLLGIEILGSDSQGKNTEIDLSLLGEAESVTPQASIPNIDGSYARLQTWIIWLLSVSSSIVVNSLTVMKALSVEKDDYTLEIMQRLKNIKGFEEIERFIDLRSGIVPGPTVQIRIASQVAQLQASDGTYDGSTCQRQVSCIAKSRTWRKIKQTHAQPIGFLTT